MIRFSNRRESRLGSGAVRILAGKGPEEVVGQVNQWFRDPLDDHEDREGSKDVIFERLESSEEESEGDLGAQDKKILNFVFS